jgi:hypothetical protein
MLLRAKWSHASRRNAINSPPAAAASRYPPLCQVRRRTLRPDGPDCRKTPAAATATHGHPSPTSSTGGMCSPGRDPGSRRTANHVLDDTDTMPARFPDATRPPCPGVPSSPCSSTRRRCRPCWSPRPPATPRWPLRTGARDAVGGSGIEPGVRRAEAKEMAWRLAKTTNRSVVRIMNGSPSSPMPTAPTGGAGPVGAVPTFGQYPVRLSLQAPRPPRSRAGRFPLRAGRRVASRRSTVRSACSALRRGLELISAFGPEHSARPIIRCIQQEANRSARTCVPTEGIRDRPKPSPRRDRSNGVNQRR